MNIVSILPNSIEAPLLVCDEGLSFWGGVDPNSGMIVDSHHPQHNETVSGKAVLMPTSRGSCSGSGVLLELVLRDTAPAALLFREKESILTLGALVASELYNRQVAVYQLDEAAYKACQNSERIIITSTGVQFDDSPTIPVSQSQLTKVSLSSTDVATLEGEEGEAASVAMRVLLKMAEIEGAEKLIDISSVHIDGCIYASPANLDFALKMKEMGATVKVSTTTNAISVDHANWRKQGIEEDFGVPAAKLADAYAAMGAERSYTCAPYFLSNTPEEGDVIAWAESNAVVYANSVLGAITNKHADFLDLFMAITGRAADGGVYKFDQRQPQTRIQIDIPEDADDLVWPLIGWLVGKTYPNAIPLVTGLSAASPDRDALQAMCAAFGTTSSAPMMVIEGITPGYDFESYDDLPVIALSGQDILGAWKELGTGPRDLDVIALGSPHISAKLVRDFNQLLDGVAKVNTIVTVSRETYSELNLDNTVDELLSKKVNLVVDTCWCMIQRPLFPLDAQVILTNSGKYAHYGPGLSGCMVRIASLSDCAKASQQGFLEVSVPKWLGA